MTVRLLPPVEQIVTAWLRASTDLDALVTDRIGTELYSGSSSAIWLSLVTGTEPVRSHLAVQQLDVRFYGGTKAQALTLALTGHDVMLQMPGVRPLGIVSTVRTLTLPSWNPDEDFTPPRPRYIASYEVVSHPALS